jgi:tetratricopeptide (TPR) repeat protein
MRDPGLGVRLRTIRVARGLTQAQLAGSDYSVAYVSRIESGERTPSPEALEVFTKRLGISPESLLSPIDEASMVALESEHVGVVRAMDAADWQGAKAAAGRLLELAKRVGTPRFTRIAHWANGEVNERLGDAERAIELYRQAQAADPEMSLEDRTEMTVCLARAFRTLGDLGHSADLLERALADLQPHAGLQPRLLARVCTHLASTYHERGDMVRSRQVALEGLRHARMADDKRTLANALWAAAPPVAVADPARALSLIRRAGTLYAELGFTLELGRLQEVWGTVARSAGDRAGARVAFERSLEFCQEGGSASDIARTLECLAELELEEGNAEEAVRLARRVCELVETVDPVEHARACRVLGAGLSATDPESAMGELLTSIEGFRAAGAPMEAARSLRMLGELYLKMGREDEALEAFREGLGVVEGAA